jgi:small nuclear ribonucleoprotein F
MREPNTESSVDNEVIVRLKWGQEYHGRLISVDSYMNIQMRGAEEWIDGKATGNLGEVLIRYVILLLLGS